MKLFFLLLILLSTSVFSLSIDTDGTHTIGKQNIVYVDLHNAEISHDFVLYLKNSNQDVLYSWTKSEMIKNSDVLYKVFVYYPDNFIEGQYSLVVESSGNKMATKDFEVKEQSAWDKFKNFLKNMFTNIKNVL